MNLKEELKRLRKAYGEDDPEFAFNEVINEYCEYDDTAREKAVLISRSVIEKHEVGTWPYDGPRKRKPAGK